MEQEQPSELTENNPRPFLEIPPLWLKLGKMKESFFAEELPHTSVQNTLFSILIATGFVVIASVLSSLMSGIKGFLNPPIGASAEQALWNTISIGFGFCCFQLALYPLGFYIRNLVIFILALIFGGKGKYSSQAYLASLYFVPLALISAAAGFAAYLPVIGNYIVGLAVLGIMIFNFVLDIRILKVAHQLSTGRAVGALLIPLIFILIPLCLIGVLTLLGPIVGSVFSSIESQIVTPMP